MKDLVPSIGSSTQTYSASSRSLPNSSPTMPCWGKLALINRRITASAARSASVTGSKSWLVLLLSMESEGGKNRQVGLPGVSGKGADEGCKINDHHGCSLRCGAGRMCRLLPSPILQAAHGL